MRYVLPLTYLVAFAIAIAVPLLLAAVAGTGLEAVTTDVLGIGLGQVPWSLGFGAALVSYAIGIYIYQANRDPVVSVARWTFTHDGRWYRLIRIMVKVFAVTAVAFAAGGLVCGATRFGLLAFDPELYGASAIFRQSCILLPFLVTAGGCALWYLAVIKAAIRRLDIVPQPGEQSGWIVRGLSTSIGLGMIFGIGTFAGLASAIYTAIPWVQLLMAILASVIAGGFAKHQFDSAVEKEVEKRRRSDV